MTRVEEKNVSSDLVSIIEAAYDVEVDTHAWLTSVLNASQRLFDHGLGIVGGLVSFGGEQEAQVISTIGVGLPFELDANDIREAMLRLPMERTIFLGQTPFLWTRRSAPERSAFAVTDDRAYEQATKWMADDDEGPHCFISTNAPSIGRRSTRLMQRVATHLCAGYRLHRRLRALVADSVRVDAVIDPSGRVQHAEGEAREPKALAQLSSGARTREHARGKLRRHAPLLAVEEWKGLISARWTLVDHFESDGRRYLVARRNAPKVESWGPLTNRESQVLRYASLGQSNKVIAYDLGISDATVRVLIARAAKKLGCRTRAELIQKLAEDGGAS
jgi:DNA-binding CsgD family transcriptional regulator